MRPKKESHLKCPLESSEAKSLIQWAHLTPIVRDYLIHIPNEGKRSARAGRRLNQEGLVKGVSDYFLAYPNGGYSGFWLELKRKNGTHLSLTKEQYLWLYKMHVIGYKSVIAYGWEDAKDKILEYIK